MPHGGGRHWDTSKIDNTDSEESSDDEIIEVARQSVLVLRIFGMPGQLVAGLHFIAVAQVVRQLLICKVPQNFK